MKKLKQYFSLLAAVTFLFGVALQVLPNQQASANQITARRLTLQAGTTDGGSAPDKVVNHFFEFTLPTAGNVGSIKFEYCTLAATACVVPTGLSTAGATMGSQNGATGFTLNKTLPDGSVYLTRASAPIAANLQVSYQLLGVHNPTAANETFFVRITTYASTDTTGSGIDAGTVTAATAEPIVLTGVMPESLVFCTGETVGLDIATSTVPDCSTATDGTIDFNQLFSPTDTAVATSQMAASTNAGSGYVISVNGDTMTSGSNTIPGMAAQGVSVKGLSRFGLNLKANTTASAASFPYTSAEVAPAANATNYRGEAAAGYEVVDQFKFVTTDTVAASTNGGAGGTDAQIFTASYIVNVSGSQPAGTYTTTLTYICTPTF
jgi:hypothetical protein